MTKRSRYFLLLIGFIIFLVVAPVIVLYVRGITYDFSTHRFVSTGIFGVETEPTDVKIFLNGKQKRSGAGDIKFVLPGEYQITVTKTGYQTWSKRLSVAAGQVTWVNPANSPIYLLLNAPTPKILAAQVLDSYGLASNFSYLTAKTFTCNGQSYILPEPVNKILAHDAAGKNFVLAEASSTAQNLLYFNSSTATFTDLSLLFSQEPQMQFNDNGDLYALSSGVLYKIDLNAKTKTEVLKDVLAFDWQGGSLYYIERIGSVISLLLTQDPFSQSQLLLNQVPEFYQGSLIVTFEKQIFLLADGALYQDDGSFQKIADNVTNFNFDPANSNLSFSHAGEFDYIDSGSNLNFITRSSQALNNLIINTNIGYAFYSSGGEISAIELDARDSQNQYVLYNGQNVENFSLDSSGKNMLVLDNGELKSIVIR